MSQINIAATKTNLIKAKKSLSLTIEGHELLDEKRRILLLELTNVMDKTSTLQRQVNDALQLAYQIVDKAVITMGRRKMEEISLSIDLKNNISIANRRLMGVTVPNIQYQLIDNPPYYSAYQVNFYLDEAVNKFKAVLKLLAQLAEKRITLLRLAKEVQKTIRKVNALEKVYMPYYKDAVKSISDRLDEESREGFATLKILKQRLKT